MDFTRTEVESPALVVSSLYWSVPSVSVSAGRYFRLPDFLIAIVGAWETRHCTAPSFVTSIVEKTGKERRKNYAISGVLMGMYDAKRLYCSFSEYGQISQQESIKAPKRGTSTLVCLCVFVFTFDSQPPLRLQSWASKSTRRRGSAALPEFGHTWPPNESLFDGPWGATCARHVQKLQSEWEATHFGSNRASDPMGATTLWSFPSIARPWKKIKNL